MITDDPANPWSASGWSLTGQMTYFTAHGQARSEARARDAGTKLGGPRPVILGMVEVGKPGSDGARKYARVQTVRPGNPAIWKFMVPQKRDEGDVRIVDTGETRSVDGNESRTFKD